VPGIDLDAYKAELLVRFANPAIRDTLARLAQDASDRIPKWLLPVVRWNLAHDGRVGLSAAVVASWARYAEGVDESGGTIEVADGLASTLVPLARTYPADPLGFVENEQVFGDLAQDPRFTEPYLETLATLHRAGAQAALREALAR
jgi:mannitol 2-dehydrogenase